MSKICNRTRLGHAILLALLASAQAQAQEVSQPDAAVSATLGTVIVTALGLVSGWLGGGWDNLIMRGVDVAYVAPVEVGDRAWTAAGSVVTNDVPPGALGVARERQRNVEGYDERRRSGPVDSEST